MAKQRFILVGGGYRAMYYVRVAQAHPDEFELAAVYCRSEESAAKARAKGLPAEMSAEACAALKPDFAVIAVSRSAMYDVAREWALRGIPVIAETPIADSFEQLCEIWELACQGKIKYQSAEQYLLRPKIQANYQRVCDGLIGKPYHMYLSRAHEYHGASLIRRFLLADFEPFTICGRAYQEQLTETGSRAGEIRGGKLVTRERRTLLIDFEGGAHAIYDFNGEQYRGMLHEYALYLDGERGALANDVFHYIDADGGFSALDVPPDRGCTCLDDDEDEAAIRTIMLSMPRFAATGESVYPLRDALQDSYMSVLMKRAVEEPYKLIKSEKTPW